MIFISDVKVSIPYSSSKFLVNTRNLLELQAIKTVTSADVQANQSVMLCSVFTFIRRNQGILIGKFEVFCCNEMDIKDYFIGSRYLEILFCFHFMRVYEFCSISNIDQTT